VYGLYGSVFNQTLAVGLPSPLPIVVLIKSCQRFPFVTFCNFPVSGEEQPQAPAQAGADLLESSSAERDWECWGTTG